MGNVARGKRSSPGRAQHETPGPVRRRLTSNVRQQAVLSQTHDASESIINVSECEYRVKLISFRLPFQIKSLVEREGLEGWRAQRVGRDLMILERTRSGEAFQQNMISITLHSNQRILETIEKQASEGWEIGSLGSNFLFLHRPCGRESDPGIQYRIEKIATMSPPRIVQFTSDLATEGWEMKSLGAASAIFAKDPQRTGKIESRLENIAMKTPRGIENFLAKESQDGWRITGLARIYLSLGRRSEASA